MPIKLLNFERAMLLTIADVLPPGAIDDIHKTIAAGHIAFQDGGATAGWQAKSVKNNEQAAGAGLEPMLASIRAALLANPVFAAAAQPKQLLGVMLSRYRPGMAYGTHVDNALMSGIRTDLSFTVFLSEPASYDGGALVIEGNGEEHEIKLAPGCAVVYPTTSLHHVRQVTSGQRLAVVGWVRSFIRSHENREVLFDVENVIATMRLQSTDRALLNQMLKVRANLQRGWVED
jgi:PKHD-type hydroxylase